MVYSNTVSVGGKSASISLSNESNFFLSSFPRLPPSDQVREKRNHISIICAICSLLTLAEFFLESESKRIVSDRTEDRGSTGTSSLHCLRLKSKIVSMYLSVSFFSGSTKCSWDLSCLLVLSQDFTKGLQLRSSTFR